MVPEMNSYLEQKSPLQPILGRIKALHTYKISDLVQKYCLHFLKFRGN